MKLSLGFQMDSVDKLVPQGDTTIRIMLEAQKRGHQLYYFQPQDLTLYGPELKARARKVVVHDRNQNFFSLGAPDYINLAELDVVFMRQDPPFDMAYLSATYLLETIADKILVVNNPTQVRNSPEKIIITEFQDLIPPTIISGDKDLIIKFIDTHQEVVIKPLYYSGGHGVFLLRKGDDNTMSLLDFYSTQFREPLVVQRYEPSIIEGDKRIILIDGEPKGIIKRLPTGKDIRTNLHAGGTVVKTTFSERDLAICNAIAPTIRQRDLLFVGIDIIGQYLTEINVTSPTCIREIEHLYQLNLAEQLLNSIDNKLARLRS